MNKLFILSSVLLIPLQMVIAQECPLSKTNATIFTLSEISSSINKVETPNGIRYETSEDFTEKIELHVKAINDHPVKPEKDIIEKSQALAKEMVDSSLINFKQLLEKIKNDLDSTEVDEKLANKLYTAYAESYEKISESIRSATATIKSEKQNISTLSSLTASLTALQAHRIFKEEASNMLYDLQNEITKICFPLDLGFKTKIDGEELQLSRCSDVGTHKIDHENWGGKINEGHCRHIVSCRVISQKVTSPATKWILDCRKEGNTCPKLSKCAAQIESGSGKASKPKAQGIIQ